MYSVYLTSRSPSSAALELSSEISMTSLLLSLEGETRRLRGEASCVFSSSNWSIFSYM